MDLVTSMKALNKTVEASQLTSDLGGSFTYSHADWLQFHQVPAFPAAAGESQSLRAPPPMQTEVQFSLTSPLTQTRHQPLLVSV